MNWKIRFKNPVFIVTTFIPGFIILCQLIVAFTNEFIVTTGYTITNDAVNGLMGIVNFIAITFLGVGGVIDPTTRGITDSRQALEYDRPKEKDSL